MRTEGNTIILDKVEDFPNTHVAALLLPCSCGKQQCSCRMLLSKEVADKYKVPQLISMKQWNKIKGK